MHPKTYLIAILALLLGGVATFFLIPEPNEEDADIVQQEIKLEKERITQEINALELEVDRLSQENSREQYILKMNELQSARQALAKLNQSEHPTP